MCFLFSIGANKQGGGKCDSAGYSCRVGRIVTGHSRLFTISSVSSLLLMIFAKANITIITSVQTLLKTFNLIYQTMALFMLQIWMIPQIMPLVEEMCYYFSERSDLSVQEMIKINWKSALLNWSSKKPPRNPCNSGLYKLTKTKTEIK